MGSSGTTSRLCRVARGMVSLDCFVIQKIEDEHTLNGEWLPERFSLIAFSSFLDSLAISFEKEMTSKDSNGEQLYEKSKMAVLKKSYNESQQIKPSEECFGRSELDDKTLGRKIDGQWTDLPPSLSQSIHCRPKPYYSSESDKINTQRLVFDAGFKMSLS